MRTRRILAIGLTGAVLSDQPGNGPDTPEVPDIPEPGDTPDAPAP
jgi:hypothetical protein